MNNYSNEYRTEYSNENKTEYANEYKGTNNKKKNTKAALKVFIVGLIISLIICGIGFIKQKNLEKKNNNSNAVVQEKIKEKEKQIVDIENQITDLKSKKKEIDDKENNIKLGDENWFEESEKLSEESFNLSKEISNLDSKIWNLETEIKLLKFQKNKVQKVSNPIVNFFSYKLFYWIGGIIFSTFLIISLIIHLVTKRK